MRQKNLKDQLRPYFRGSLVGLAVGDALGMPVETMTRNQILAATGGKGVTDFIEPIQRRIRDTVSLVPGTWTDDTQLALAVARSLIQSQGFDIEDQAREHVKALNESKFGWGRTTTLAVEQLRDGLRKPTDKAPTGPKIGRGNGVAMKIAPMGLFYALSPGVTNLNAPFIQDTLVLGQMTHSDIRASIAALLIEAHVTNAIVDKLDMESTRGQAYILQHFLGIEACELDFVLEGLLDGSELVCDRFRRAIAIAREENALDILRSEIGSNCDILQSVCFSLGLLETQIGDIYFKDDYECAVLAAINSGGDTDTNAAMIGGIIGARVGLNGIPRRWIQGLYKVDEIINTADALLDVTIEHWK